MNSPSTFKLGWRPDVPDFRDFKFASLTGLTAPIKLPSRVDLRGQCPLPYNQGSLGSCTANAIATNLDYTHKIATSTFFQPSRLFIYYNERVMEGTVNIDSGAMIRNGIKSVAKQGACPESMWPYDINIFKKRPSIDCYKQALKFQALGYQRLNNLNITELKSCLALKLPFVFGMAIYPSFYTAGVTGAVPMPSLNEKMLGGHAMTCVGYDNKTRRFIVRNSWGSEWGDMGDCYIPYNYLTSTNLSDDFWVVSQSE